MIYETASSFLGNLLFWVGLGLVVWASTARTRRRFSRFFGFDGQGVLTVYLSNLWQPELARRPIGYTLSLHEFHATQTVGRLIGSSHMRLPEIVRGLVDGIWLRRAPTATFTPAPIDGPASIGRTTIVVGAASRNSVRAAYVDRSLPLLTLSHEAAGARSHDGHLAVEPYATLSRGETKGARLGAAYNPAILERLYDRDRNATVFFAAGFRADGTWGACEYLVRHWSSLQRQFKDRDFAICLGFPLSEDYMTEYIEPVRLATHVG